MNDPDHDPYLPPRAPIGVADREPIETEVPEGSPFSTIWTRPRGTIRGIVETDPTLHVTALAALAGFSNGLAQLVQTDAAEKLPMSGILAFAVVFGGLFGVLGNYLMGSLVRLTGRGLDGTATSREVRAALAWSSIPHIAMLPVLLLGMAAFRQDFLRPDGLNAASPERGVLLAALMVTLMVLGCWAVFLNVKCVAEVHRFSAWRGLGATVLAGVLLLAAIVTIVAVVVGIGMVFKGGG